MQKGARVGQHRERTPRAAFRDKGLGAIADHQRVDEFDRLVGKQRSKFGARGEIGGERLNEPLAVAALHHHQRTVCRRDVVRRGGGNEGERRKAVDRYLPAERERARCGHADAHPGKAARAASGGDDVGAAATDEFGDQRNEALGVTPPDHFVAIIDDRARLDQRHRTGFTRRIDDQMAHGRERAPLRRCG